MVVSDKIIVEVFIEVDVFVVVWLGGLEFVENCEVIGVFVCVGGGLFIVDYGVGYKMWWGKFIYQVLGNLLFCEVGIGFVGGNYWDKDIIVANNKVVGQFNVDMLLVIFEDKIGVLDDVLIWVGVLFGCIYDVL